MKSIIINFIRAQKFKFIRILLNQKRDDAYVCVQTYLDVSIDIYNTKSDTELTVEHKIFRCAANLLENRWNTIM